MKTGGQGERWRRRWRLQGGLQLSRRLCAWGEERAGSEVAAAVAGGQEEEHCTTACTVQYVMHVSHYLNTLTVSIVRYHCISGP